MSRSNEGKLGKLTRGRAAKVRGEILILWEQQKHNLEGTKTENCTSGVERSFFLVSNSKTFYHFANSSLENCEYKEMAYLGHISPFLSFLIELNLSTECPSKRNLGINLAELHRLKG
jgi:hypothetical protein